MVLKNTNVCDAYYLAFIIATFFGYKGDTSVKRGCCSTKAAKKMLKHGLRLANGALEDL